VTAVLIVVIAIVAAILIYGFSIAEPYKPGEARSRPTVKARRDAQIICQQCQTRGRVTTRQVTLKNGISGGKATGALLTGGLSLLATGLSRKEDATKAECANCGSVWHF
jgi:hypothetical protein